MDTCVLNVVEALLIFVGVFSINTLGMTGAEEDPLTRLRGRYGREDLTFDVVEEQADQLLEEELRA